MKRLGEGGVEAYPSKIFHLSLHMTKFSEFAGERSKIKEQSSGPGKEVISFVPKDVSFSTKILKNKSIVLK